jgi:membrane fusion protein (multidrug efflux system)
LDTNSSELVTENKPADQEKPEADSNEKPEERKDQTPQNPRKRRRALLIFGLVLLVAVVAGVLYWLHSRHFESTDNAQVDGNLSPIGTRINGTVIRVYVNNNQAVKVGDPLADLDPKDYLVSLDQARAQLAQARGQLGAQQPNVPITQVETTTNISASEANVAGALAALAAAQRDRDQAAAQVLQQEAANARAQRDVERYTILVQKEEVSRIDFDQVATTAQQSAANLLAQQSALQAAEKNVDQRRAAVLQAKSQLQQTQSTAAPQLRARRATVQQQQAAVQTAQAQVEQAQLDLSYTKIVAAVAGVVLKRSAQVGARVTAGQQLLTISQIGDLWITANFKETQMLHMRPGQRATIHVDALAQDFTGYVYTIGGATGSVASILPPENATGNFVKVVQRIPVRINLDPNQGGAERLRPGMSVEPSVRVF